MSIQMSNCSHFAWCTLDEIAVLARQNAIVDGRGIEFLVQIRRHLVGQHPNGALVVDLHVVREDESVRIGIDQTLGVRCVGTLDVPAGDGVFVHLRVEDDAGLGVKDLGGGLTIHATVTYIFKVIVRIAAGHMRFVLQHSVGDLELFGTGQSMEVDVLGVIRIHGTHRHSKDAVRPLEVHAADIEVALQGVEVEEIVLDAVGFVVSQGVHNHTIGTQVRDIGEGILALRAVGIHNLGMKYVYQFGIQILL